MTSLKIKQIMFCTGARPLLASTASPLDALYEQVSELMCAIVLSGFSSAPDNMVQAVHPCVAQLLLLDVTACPCRTRPFIGTICVVCSDPSHYMQVATR